MKKIISLIAAISVIGNIVFGASVLANEHKASPKLPGYIDITQPPYSADNTGNEDVTWIMQRAIAHNIGKTRTIYFPSGTYRVSRTIEWIIDRWVGMDFGEPTVISQVSLSWKDALDKTYYFEIEVSNDKENWEVVYANGEYSGDEAMQHYAFSPVTAQYVRIQGYGDNANISIEDVEGKIALNEIEVYNYKEENIISQATLYMGNSASITEKNMLKNLVDNDINTNWYTVGEPYHRLSFQGEDKESVRIKLDDNAPFFEGKNIAVIRTRNMLDDYNDAFLNNIYDITVDIGSSNPTAIGISWMVCNLGTVRDVNIVSGDGSGYRGLYCDGWPGPGLAKNIYVEGFDYGIEVRTNKHGMTFENITLKNQNICGFVNKENGVFINNLTSYNEVTAINAGTRLTVIKNSNLYKSVKTDTPGITLSGDGEICIQDSYVDDNYLSAVSKGDTILAKSGIIKEYVSKYSTLSNTAKTMLHLEVEEAPEFEDYDINNIAVVTDYKDNSSDDDTAAIQAAIDSGRETVYFPPGDYIISDTIHVRGNVKRILGCYASTINTRGPVLYAVSGENPAFKIETSHGQAIIIERLMFDNCPLTIENASSDTLVLRDGDYHSYTNTNTSGKLFIENIICDDLVINQQKVWARQLNAEGNGYEPLYKVVNNGGNFWCLGMKTEMCSGAIQTNDGGKTELLGGYIFSNSGTWNMPIIDNNESEVCASLTQYAWNAADFFNIMVRETRNGVVRDLNRWEVNEIKDQGVNMSCYTGVTDAVQSPDEIMSEITLKTDSNVYNENESFSIELVSDGELSMLNKISIYRYDAYPDSSNNGGPIKICDGTQALIEGLNAGCYFFYAVGETEAGNKMYSPFIKITVRPQMQTGRILREYWGVLDGFKVNNLETRSDYPNDPDLWDYTDSFASPALERAYGIKMKGYIIPPQDGEYTFCVTGNKQALVRLSTDDTVENKKLICYIEDYTGSTQYDKFTSQKSEPVMLEGGKKYYIEAVQTKENGDGGYLNVLWSNNGEDFSVISGEYLMPYDNYFDEPETGNVEGDLVIFPEEDTFVRGGGTANTSYGSSIYLNVEDTAAFSYLKFNLKDINDSVASAKLVLVPTKIEAVGAVHRAELVHDDYSWSEDSLKWADRPQTDANITSSEFQPINVGEPVTVNISDMVRYELENDSDKILSIALKMVTGPKGQVYYGSSEHFKEFNPYIVVTYGEPEEDPSKYNDPPLVMEEGALIDDNDQNNFIEWKDTSKFNQTIEFDEVHGNVVHLHPAGQSYTTNYTVSEKEDVSGYKYMGLWYKGSGVDDVLSLAFFNGSSKTLKYDINVSKDINDWKYVEFKIEQGLLEGFDVADLNNITKMNVNVQNRSDVYIDGLCFYNKPDYQIYDISKTQENDLLYIEGYAASDISNVDSVTAIAAEKNEYGLLENIRFYTTDVSVGKGKFKFYFPKGSDNISIYLWDGMEKMMPLTGICND